MLTLEHRLPSFITQRHVTSPRHVPYVLLFPYAPGLSYACLNFPFYHEAHASMYSYAGFANISETYVSPAMPRLPNTCPSSYVPCLIPLLRLVCPNLMDVSEKRYLPLFPPFFQAFINRMRREKPTQIRGPSEKGRCDNLLPQCFQLSRREPALSESLPGPWAESATSSSTYGGRHVDLHIRAEIQVDDVAAASSDDAAASAALSPPQADTAPEQRVLLGIKDTCMMWPSSCCGSRLNGLLEKQAQQLARNLTEWQVEYSKADLASDGF